MHPSTALAHVIVDELVRGGVREAVLSPGSRNAPLAFAMHTADRAGQLRLHVRIDERSAGFLALGLAMSGRPVPVVCTSGTAATNLHPAVIEADAAGVALLAVTADRPPELRGVGANQTIVQSGLFGRAVTYAAELDAHGVDADQNGYWRTTICRALAASRSGPGPVHLNVAFRLPLVPEADPQPPASLDGRADGRPWTATHHTRPARSGPERLDLRSRTLIVLGDTTPEAADAADRLATAARLPLIAEPGAGWRCRSALPGGQILLRAEAFLDKHPPEQVVIIGRPTLGRSVARLIRRPGVTVTAIDDQARWSDPEHRAQQVAGATALDPRTVDHDPDDGWLPTWRAADAVVREVRAAWVAPTWPSGPAVAGELITRLPPGALLFLGASSPIRDVDLMAAGRHDLTVATNRGASGIDGTVSTAIGATLALQRATPTRPAYALLGDLTLLHDANGLVLGPDEPRPALTIVVPNNNGGGLFNRLEQGADEYADSFERIFGTPHDVDLGALCTSTGTAFTRVSSAADFASAIAPGPGIRVVEVPMTRDRDRAATVRLVEAADAAAAGVV